MTNPEIALMERVQRVADTWIPSAARAYSRWGDHAAGWIALGVAGAALSKRHRTDFLAMTGAVVLAHGSAVVTKRVVRRRRPSDGRIRVLDKTPSDLSFPSAHTASTTAAAAALAPVVGAPLASTAVATMAASRVLLGVHYPSDVAAGAALGLAAATVVRRWRRAAQQ